jgi:hypothetical protein
VIRDRFALPQYGHASGSNFHLAVHRPQMRSRSAAGVIVANSGSPPHTGHERAVQDDRSADASIASAHRIR